MDTVVAAAVVVAWVGVVGEMVQRCTQILVQMFASAERAAPCLIGLRQPFVYATFLYGWQPGARPCHCILVEQRGQGYCC